MCCPVGQHQCLEFDACRDGKPVKVPEKGSDMREFRLVEHQTAVAVRWPSQSETVGLPSPETKLGKKASLAQFLDSYGIMII